MTPLIHQILIYSAGTSLLILAVGLYEPWIALWWMATQHRKKVILLYGGLAVVFWLLSLVI